MCLWQEEGAQGRNHREAGKGQDGNRGADLPKLSGEEGRENGTESGLDNNILQHACTSLTLLVLP